jgi:DNA-binding NarL/FixJ family response regulator
MIEQPVARVLLADDQSLFRQAVRIALEHEDDLIVAADAGDGRQAVAEAQLARPDVALLGASLRGCDGIKATEMIREHLPTCQVIVVGDEPDEDCLIAALDAGAIGYITKESPLLELIEAIRTVRRGEILVPHGMLGPLLFRLIRNRRQVDEAVRQLSRLTPRERQVLMLLAEGANNDSIATALVISPQTARTHIQNVIGKLGVHSRLEAAMFAMQNGVIDHLRDAARSTDADITQAPRTDLQTVVV